MGDAPVACCFTLGFANNQVPCCFESQKVENKAGCTLDAPPGGALGFNGTICPESADEAQCLVQFAVPPARGKRGKISPQATCLRLVLSAVGCTTRASWRPCRRRRLIPRRVSRRRSSNLTR